MPFKIVSLNVGGLNSPQRRTTLQKEIAKQHADILFVQEMHFALTKTPTFKLEGYDQTILASGPNGDQSHSSIPTPSQLH